jgi:hypothetical protein
MRTTKKAKITPRPYIPTPMPEPLPLPPEDEALCTAWDDLRNTIQRVLTALPHQMSEASVDMEAAHKTMDRSVRNAMMARAKDRTGG